MKHTSAFLTLLLSMMTASSLVCHPKNSFADSNKSEMCYDVCFGYCYGYITSAAPDFNNFNPNCASVCCTGG